MTAAQRSHAISAIAQEAEGALVAQQCVDRLADQWTTTDFAWLAFIELASKFGWRSPACRGYLCELAKRAA
jgi:hypothetical protein